ncbi:MAG: hypothetical protein SPL42_08350 [Bacteroidales bacterium]|nr:hypothetical protein [Bacteroidales bacterium]
MRKAILAIALCAICLLSCKKMEERSLRRQMVSAAKEFLAAEEVSGYEKLAVKCIDTITEVSYARLTTELLSNMESSYEAMLYQEGSNSEVIPLYLNEIIRTRKDMEDLLESGDLDTEGVLLYWVTATYVKDGKDNEFMFMVEPDKRTLHTLDPFGDNLLYKE